MMCHVNLYSHSSINAAKNESAYNHIHPHRIRAAARFIMVIVPESNIVVFTSSCSERLRDRNVRTITRVVVTLIWWMTPAIVITCTGPAWANRSCHPSSGYWSALKISIYQQFYRRWVTNRYIIHIPFVFIVRLKKKIECQIRRCACQIRIGALCPHIRRCRGIGKIS